MSVSFTASQAGQYQVSVTFRGKHLQGSPFDLEVVDRHVYRCDYSKVSYNPAGRFGSDGADDGQFSDPCSVACNSRERLLLLIIPTIAFRCLIEMASSCLSLDRKEMEMASFIVLVV